MNKPAVCIVIVSIAAILVPGAHGQPTDLPSTSDHTAISRFAGSALIAYDQKSFDEYELVLSIWDRTEREWTTSRMVEGRVSRRAYIAPEGTTLVEAFRNFETAIEGADLEVLFSCRAPECGVGTTFSSGLYRGMPDRLRATDHYHNFNSIKEFAYIAAEGEHQGKQLWIGVGMGIKAAAGIRYRDADSRVQKVQTDRLVFFIDVIEGAAMRTGMVTVTADALEEGMKRDGKVMLAGVFFDTNKAVVKPESKIALEAIAGYLKSKPGVKFFVAGHTDATGSYDHNLELSDARAKAVVTTLSEEYGISASRLMAVGVGPVAPIASNDTEDGRAGNRRVELVKRPN